jgi:hypothetical protein
LRIATVRHSADAAQADRALYLAKENGRDRVEVAALGGFVARAGEGARALAAPNAAQTPA